MFNYNPFKENRTEQMHELWKYYVPIPEMNNTGKPLVVEGGRGSGKTMFFQCNSWKELTMKIKKENKPIESLFSEYDFIGLYYRVDTTFVSSMKKLDFDKWDSVFETYLSICILKEIISLIIELKNDLVISNDALIKFSKTFSKKIYPDSNADTITDFYDETSLYLDKIEDLINGLDVKLGRELRLVNAHRYITDLCKATFDLFDRNVNYRIFIDEYESLQDSQQKIVNTLIKHSELPVIFNIGLRPSGMRTSATVSETESIESPHDYERLTLDIDVERFEILILDICKKRIQLAKEAGKIPSNAHESIDWYLGNYDFNYEINKIENGHKNYPFSKALRKRIKERAIIEDLSDEETEKYIEILCDNAPLVNSRLHLTLLYNDNVYTPLLKDLSDSYLNKDDRYNDWMHNRKFAIMFLLCKEFKREKLYFGTDAFISMSSGIIRYFLELCEQTFKLAFLDDYTWNEPIVPETQSEAARYVSEYKIKDIISYQPYGKELRIFVQYLGKIFNKIHTDDGSLGEPEPNHFSTKDLAISENVTEHIRSAIMCNVLQQKKSTKRKDSVLSPETTDYYLNKIYAPYFGISYRNQRKITINNELLEKLFSGNDHLANEAFKEYFNSRNNYNPAQFTFNDINNGDDND